MSHLFNTFIASDLGFQIVAGIIGILSMIAARMLDWYFPSNHHRHFDKDEADENERVKKHKKVEDSTEDSDSDE